MGDRGREGEREGEGEGEEEGDGGEGGQTCAELNPRDRVEYRRALKNCLCLGPTAVDDDEGAAIRAPHALMLFILKIHHGRRHLLVERIHGMECRK